MITETITKPTDWTTMLNEAVIGNVLPFDEKHARSVRTLIGGTIRENKPDYVFATKVAKGKLFVVRVF